MSTRPKAPSFEFMEAANSRLRETLLELRPILLEASGKIEHTLKPDDSVVTTLDLMVERRIYDTLREIDPTIGKAGEETGADFSQPLFWLVDPIDGTESFIRGLPFFTSMIALIYEGEALMAIIYNHTQDEYFLAFRNHGATLNGHPIHVSDRSLSRSVIACGSKIEIGLHGLSDRLRRQIKSIFSVAASGYTLSSIARGSIDGKLTIGTSSKPWDMAPGALLITEAGGRVTNISSDAYDYLDVHLIASNGHIHKQLEEFVASELSRLKVKPKES